MKDQVLFSLKKKNKKIFKNVVSAVVIVDQSLKHCTLILSAVCQKIHVNKQLQINKHFR